MNRLHIAAFAVVGVLVLYQLSYPTYSCRYRMTVTVDVDGQPRSGSSIIEYRMSKQPQLGWIFNPYKTGVSGEAVFVDLGGQRNVVALLASGPNAENAGFPEGVVRSHFTKPSDFDRYAASLPSLRGNWELSDADLPTLITFSNPSDPATIKVIRTDQLEQVFGPGVRWRGVRIEMTTEAVTRGIELRLPWVSKLDGSVTIRPGKITLNGPYFKQ